MTSDLDLMPVKVLRIAPARDGQQIASVWRVWAQGNEFYAASRDVIKLGKVSFHQNLNWQYQLGTLMRRLARPLCFSEGWLHALQISFLIQHGLLLPRNQTNGKVVFCETPVGNKLVLNLLLSSQRGIPNIEPPVEIGGTVVTSYRLRAGTSLIVTKRVLEMDGNDLKIIDDVQAKLRINVSGETLPDPKEIYFEAVWHKFDRMTGNAIAVVPAGYHAIQLERGNFT